MVTKEQAKFLLSFGHNPFIASATVCWICGLKPVTLRQWIHKGHLELRFTPRPGTGSPMHFSIPDLMEIMAMTQLSRLNFPPSEFARSAAEVARSGAMTHLRQIAGEWGEVKEEWADLHRYLILFADTIGGGDVFVRWVQHNKPCPERILDASWITIDCKELMLKTVQRLELSKAHIKKK
jgi:hypothetical protein